jgi:DNA polymerase-3 subunit epsilon
MFDRAKGLEVLKAAQSDKAKEKWLRESYKDGNEDSVKHTLEEIIDNPQSDTLLAFAEDFYARKYHKKRTSTVTDMLRNASRALDT